MKRYLLEYYAGNPDTMIEYDDSTRSYVATFKYDEEPGISFGWFQTELDEVEKKFFYEKDICHYDLVYKIAENIVGKAVANERIGEGVVEDIAYAIACSGAFKGRTFDKPKIITTYHKLSSNKLRDIVENIGGVEKFEGYRYVFPDYYDIKNKTDISGKDLDLIEYLNSNDSHTSEVEENMMEKDFKEFLTFPDWVYETIRSYNNPTETWQSKKEKEGWKTLAQRNATIYQEEKKPKNTIKENSMKGNNYKKEFSSYISIMKEALSRENFDAYNAAKDMLDESIEERVHEKALEAELNTDNFGILNHIFEERLPELFKKDKKAVKDVIKTIKEDSNLLGQFNYYNAIKNYKGKMAENVGPEEIAEKLNEAIVATINRETVLKSNAKLRRVLKEHNIIPTEFVSDDMKKLYESGHNILTKKHKSMNNVLVLAESTKNICDYMTRHKDDSIIESVDPDKLIKEFKERLKDTLTESEMSFVQQITDWRSPIAEQRKEKLFNKFKNECIEKLDEMLKEDSTNEELVSLKKQLEEQKFNNGTIVKDIAKLLEIRDILLEK